MFKKYNRKNLPLHCAEQQFHSDGVKHTKKSCVERIPPSWQLKKSQLSIVSSLLPVLDNGIYHKPSEVINIEHFLAKMKITCTCYIKELLQKNSSPGRKTQLFETLHSNTLGKQIKVDWNMNDDPHQLLNQEERKI